MSDEENERRWIEGERVGECMCMDEASPREKKKECDRMRRKGREGQS
jgi:hypothetical protein